MPYQFTHEDVAFLAGADGTAALEATAELALRPDTMVGDVQRLSQAYPGQQGALTATVLARRALAPRVAAAADWLLTEDAAQQATADAVARLRAQELARRCPGASVHDVTCSVGTELDSLLCQPDLGRVLGSDLDDVRLAMARHNVPGAALLRADALTATSRADVVIADPGRRAGARRTFRMSDTRPPLPDLLGVLRGRLAVVKCAPGVDYSLLRDEHGFTGQVQAISLDGGVREVCLWTLPGMAGRRATVVRSDGSGFEVDDTEPDDVGADAPGRWIVDPDGAVVRAGLVRHYAHRHGLWQLDPHLAYLTGDALPPGARGWPVLEEMRLSAKPLRKRLAQLDCGTLEITVRGVDIDPDQLRRQLKPAGTRSMTLVVARIGDRPTVYICDAGQRAEGTGPTGRPITGR
ncbi:class I SAM-dependent methyltransferase [Jongsikchunia kroppenstedtii]|uniref:class I SAM-dependent methyltransferase n=1 Tax=Jongsikchunia kroppenstedtii TaxID=1121721 RepID=UPI0003A53184|nr:SAM-dependent methyltransferase [Jongsikchunia kroppenstedtii]